MSRRPLIGGNWKLHHAPEAAAALGGALKASLAGVDGVDVVVFPTALSIPATVAALDGSLVSVGVQDVHAEPSGAHTGTNSAVMARAAGCGWALAGHSEVRRDLGATDAQVHASVVAAFEAGLLPMLCVGETLDERDAGQVADVITRQVSEGLGDMAADQVATLAIAYEPVWAIGTGRTASPEQAQEAHALIRGLLAERYPPYVAEQVRILYGGSVKPHNAAELMGQPDIDGALVGGASLEADSFTAIVEAAAG